MSTIYYIYIVDSLGPEQANLNWSGHRYVWTQDSLLRCTVLHSTNVSNSCGTMYSSIHDLVSWKAISYDACPHSYAIASQGIA